MQMELSATEAGNTVRPSSLDYHQMKKEVVGKACQFCDWLVPG